jgi:hypothetical protein
MEDMPGVPRGPEWLVGTCLVTAGRPRVAALADSPALGGRVLLKSDGMC